MLPERFRAELCSSHYLIHRIYTPISFPYFLFTDCEMWSEKEQSVDVSGVIRCVMNVTRKTTFLSLWFTYYL